MRSSFKAVIRSRVPAPVLPLLLVLALGLVACGALAWAPAAARAQAGVDRPGKDYANFTVRSGDPAVCAARCDRDARCRAWSFSYPTPNGAKAQCWLKGEVPPRVDSGCCISGVRGGGVIEPRRGENEFAIDRVGGDYRNFEPPAPADQEVCANACKADPRCRAWTYARPGYEGQAPRCYLKNRITPPRRKPCCISGVVR